MKKTIYLVAAIFSIAVIFTSCKETKKEASKTESHENHGAEKMASHDVYQCPMDCEKGKTYEKEGSCPVCKMDLRSKSHDADGQHTDTCKCKEGGECTCAPGKCQCKAETASKEKSCDKCKEGECKCGGKEVAEKQKECSKCEPGSCECKA